MADQNKQDSSQKSYRAQTMPDPQNRERRTALRKLFIGAGALTAYQVLPTKWTSPIIDQIVLPAHAQTSGISLNDPCDLGVTGGTTSSTSVSVRVDGFVTPPTANLPATIVATPVGGNGAPVTVNTTTTASGTFGADITVLGGPGITSVNVVTTVNGADGSASCTANVPEPAPSPTTTEQPGPTTTVWITTSFPA